MTDFLLVAWVSALIEITRFGWMLGLGKRWTPGEKLKLLFAGYNGTRNTGSDVRVQEMLRQVRHGSRGRACRFQRDDAKFRNAPKDISKARARLTFPTFTRVSFSRGPAKSRRDCLRRLDVQEQVCERADDDDDRFAGAGIGGK